MSCFDPPFRAPPEGTWHCPSCPRVGETIPDEYHSSQSPEIQETHPSLVPSSPYQMPQSDAPEYPLTTDASEVEGEPTGPTPRRKSKLRKGRKGKDTALDGDVQPEAGPSTPVPTVRRLRIRVNSPAAENETPTIRLRVPARGKGKARDDGAAQEETERGLFDEILSIEDRDVRDTSIKDSDMQRFERSRIHAEVRPIYRRVCLVVLNSL